MVKSVSSCCVRGRRVLSNPVTNVYIYICVCVYTYSYIYVCVCMYVCTELEITVGHWPFSDYFRDLAEQIQFARTKSTIQF